MTIQILSAFCTFAAITGFLLWLIRVTDPVHFVTSAKARHSTAKIELPQASMLAGLTRLGVVFVPLLEWLERSSAQAHLAQRKSELDALLKKAGLRRQISPEQFFGTIFTGAVLGAGVGIGLTFLFGLGLFGMFLLGGCAGFLAGGLLPLLLLSNLAENRVVQLERRMPYALEFLSLAFAATPVFETAMREWCRLFPHDPLAEEFELALLDISHHVGTNQALVAITQRIPSQPLSAFIRAVTACNTSGQSLTEVLRQQAEAVLQQRYDAAKEMAKTASTRALGPLMLAAIAILFLLLGAMAIQLRNGSLF